MEQKHFPNNTNLLFFILFTLFLSTLSLTAQTITIQADKQGISISPHLWGIFFEDINWAADGGLYGELVQNRSFEYINVFGSNFTPTSAWSLVQRNSAAAAMTVSTQSPLNSVNNHFISLNVSNTGGGAGLSNSGYSGIAVKSGDEYRFSIWARRYSGQADSLIIRIESASGTIYATANVSGLTNAWKQYSTTLTSNSTDINARLVVLATSTGRIDMDMISLFPAKTFKNRINGLRADLAEKLADMHPGFMRFPGGCIVHSNNLATAYRWKGTIGPIEQRTTIPNRWGYLQSCGLGYFEYFQFCEDIGAEPLPVLPVGLSCHFKTPYEVVPMSEMQPWVDDALDLIEYANGPATSTWGAKRAAAGHPEPFNLKYIGVGNEEWGPEFKPRSDLFISAIRTKYPDIKIVGTAGPNVTSTDYTDLWAYNRSAQTDLVDEHYYMNVDWFKQNTRRYDSFNRNGPKVFAGEYASGTWTTTIKKLANAIAEAAFMTGLERNSDVVLLSCYAPLFRAVHCNGKPAEQPWDPDLIYFNNNASYGTPSYYTQSMFSNNTGHVLVPLDLGTSGADGPLFCVSSKDTITGEIILKVVNISVGAMTYTIHIQGVPTLEKSASRIVLTSANLNDTNGFSQPQKVAPVLSAFDSVTSSFQYRFPGNSFTIFRFATRPPVAAQKIGIQTQNPGITFKAGITGTNKFRISFNLPKQSRISAKLVDSQGKSIVTVLQEKQFNQGAHIIEWNASGGKEVGTGLYILIFSIKGRVFPTPLVRY